MQGCKRNIGLRAMFLSYVVILIQVQSDENIKWHHVAISYDGNALTIYVDNVSTNIGALKGRSTVLDKTRLGSGNSRSNCLCFCVRIFTRHYTHAHTPSGLNSCGVNV